MKISKRGNCPDCGLVIMKDEWYEKGEKVEEILTCSCGYIYHWAYGNVLKDSRFERRKNENQNNTYIRKG